MTSGQLTLLKMALEYLAGQPCGYACYAKRIKSQLALMQQGGQPITTADWVRMAKILSVEAISRDIGAQRIANTIYPLVDGLGQHAKTLCYIPAPFATTQLLRITGTDVSPEVRRLLTGVISQLQKMVTSNQPKF